MSDRAIPRSYRHDGGLRRPHLPARRTPTGDTTLVKFHWKPRLGVHSLTWEEAQLLGGIDPDFHRRDLYDAIESGAYPQWELGVQVFPDTDGRRPSRASTCSTRPSWCPRSSPRCSRSGC